MLFVVDSLWLIMMHVLACGDAVVFELPFVNPRRAWAARGVTVACLFVCLSVSVPLCSVQLFLLHLRRWFCPSEKETIALWGV